MGMVATVLAIPVLVYDNLSHAADAESSEVIVAAGATEAPPAPPDGRSQTTDPASGPGSDREIRSDAVRITGGDDGSDELLIDPWFRASGAVHSPASSSTTSAPTTTAAPITTTTAAPAPAPPPPPPTTAAPPTASAPVPSAASSESGQATWYSHIPGTCAHKTLPFGTVVTVRNSASGATTTCVVGDRGPFGAGRIIDLDPREFAQLAPLSAGVINVTISW